MDGDIPPIMRNDPSGPYEVGATYVPPPPPPNGHHKASRPLVNFDETAYSQPMDRELRAAKDEAKYQRRRADLFQDEIAVLLDQKKVDGHMHLLWSAIAVLVAVLVTTLIIFALHQGAPPPPPPGGPR